MAGDWIKMRPSLLTSPRVNGIARMLESDRAAGRALSTGFSGAMSEIVTRNVMRYVTVTALLAVWGAANEHTGDGVFRNADLSDIDDMAGIPGFGVAMEAVGWAVYDPENLCVVLPNFEEYNTCGRERSAEKSAERQRRYRERKKAKGAEESDVTRNVTNDATRNDREEKRREEIEIPPTPRKREGVRFEEFWTAWPKSERKQDKAKCLDHWRRNNLDELAGPILQDIQTKRQTQKWAEGFIEAPLVYLRGKRWMDGVTPAPATGMAEPLDWRSTQSGIRAKGVEIGLGDWDEAAFQTGQGEHFPAYRQRVEAKVREIEGRAIDPAGQRRIADLIGNAMKARA